jgi:hypothetical protein
MTPVTYSSPLDLYRKGVAILSDHLGPVDSVRFLHLFDHGHGDYTAARQAEPDDGSIAELCAEIRQARSRPDGQP